MRVVLCFLVIAVFAGNAFSAELPSFIVPCLANDPKSDQCVQDLISKIAPEFAKGIPAFGVEPLDPARLGKVVATNPALTITFTDTVVTGLGSATINSYKLNKAKERSTLDFTANVTLKAKYDMDGQILFVPIKGKGDATIEITNLNIKVVYNFKTENGYWKLVSHKNSYKMDKAQFEFTNLFNGNKQLGDTTNQFLNDNWNIIMTEVAPSAIEQIIDYALEQIGKLFDAIKADDLLLP